jgi:hypothetical protein
MSGTSEVALSLPFTGDGGWVARGRRSTPRDRCELFFPHWPVAWWVIFPNSTSSKNWWSTSWGAKKSGVELILDGVERSYWRCLGFFWVESNLVEQSAPKQALTCLVELLYCNEKISYRSIQSFVKHKNIWWYQGWIKSLLSQSAFSSSLEGSTLATAQQ